MANMSWSIFSFFAGELVSLFLAMTVRNENKRIWILVLGTLLSGILAYNLKAEESAIASSVETPAPVFTDPTMTRASVETSAPYEIIDDAGAHMVLISAGEFIMGDAVPEAQAECQKLFETAFAQNCKAEYFTDETPAHAVNLDAYYIDKYEVTNALYRVCVDSGICKKPTNTNSETHNAYYEAPQYNNYPVIWVDRNMAQTYCQWRGARLPTEAEWEKAARGDTSQIYPWGNTFDAARANSCDANCPRPGYASKNFNDGYSDLAPVDAFPTGVSVHNVFNLSGNASEWVADWYSPDAYSQNNLLGPASGGEYVIRGGSWLRFPINLRLVTRASNQPGYAANDVGFRCARDATP